MILTTYGASWRGMGSVDVMVEFDVPGLEALTEASPRCHRQSCCRRCRRGLSRCDPAGGRRPGCHAGSRGLRTEPRLPHRPVCHAEGERGGSRDPRSVAEHGLDCRRRQGTCRLNSQHWNCRRRPELGSRATTGTGWAVAILDDGIFADHDMFAGKSITQACFTHDGDCPNGQNVDTTSPQRRSAAQRRVPRHIRGRDRGRKRPECWNLRRRPRGLTSSRLIAQHRAGNSTGRTSRRPWSTSIRSVANTVSPPST